MRTKIYVILAVLLATHLASAQQKPWTLEQCVDTALVNNRNVKQQALSKQTKAIAYEQARMNLLPNLNASANQSWNFGRSVNEYYATKSATNIGISSDLTLFDGLKMKYNIDARKAELYLSDANLEKIKQDIIRSVAAGFLQILLNKELFQIANDQLSLTKSKIEQRKSLVESGKMAEGEMYEILAQESKEELSRTQAENTLKLSLLDLAQIMELDHFEDINIITPEKLLESDLDLLSANLVYESALSHRPEIKVAKYNLQNSERNVLINKADFYPTLSLGAQSGTGYYNATAANSFNKQFSDNFKSSIGLNLRVPIFNKFEVKNRVRSAQIEVESSKLQIDNAKLELKKTIQQAYYNAVGAKSRWDAALKSETASREAYRFTNQKYEAGRATLYELYQAKSNLTQVLSEQAQAKYEYFFRIKLLELLK
jgi:outer membrane protein